MASIGPTRIVFKQEPGADLLIQNPTAHFNQKTGMSQPGFNQFGGMNSHGSMDPNDMMSGSYGMNSHTFSSGSAMLGDDDLMDSLGSPTEQMGSNQGQEFGAMGFTPNMYPHSMNQGQMNGYSNTPEGDPIQSPFVHSYGRMHMGFPTSLQSPISYAGSPHPASELDTQGRMPQSMQQKASAARSPLAGKANSMLGMQDQGQFGTQPVRAGGNHRGSPSQQWAQTPNSANSYSAGFPSPIQQSMHHAQITDIMQKAGTSMPAKLGTPTNTMTSQEMKRKRRRESHNLVERRRRDNINERIQDLSKLVPTHRLEDEKVRKMINNGTPLSPTLAGVSGSSQATSGLAGPGARRATSGGAGTITTGLPMEEKDKGPNKGDILNGAVSWTRDLMWMLKLKLEQQEELINYIAEQGLPVPIDLTDDEKRMQTELFEALDKGSLGQTLSYSRTAGSGLRVPQHTDIRGEPLAGDGTSGGRTDLVTSVSPMGGDPGYDFINDDDDVSGAASLNFKEEDEYGMDLTQ